MYKKITLVLGALCFGLFAQAQDENDALLLGRTYQYGTARNLSLSGATGSLGADFGAINNNPAGLGLYRKSEFSFTPNVLAIKTDGEYLGRNTTQNEAKFNFNQAGVVFSKAKKGRTYKRSKWKTSNFSLGFNRLANMHADYTYSGRDNTSSFVENFSEEINNAGGLTNDALEVISEAAYGAYNTFLIDGDMNDSSRAASYVPFAGGLDRSKTIRRNGAINELNFSYGANYNEKVLIGFSIGLPIANYNQTEILTEDDASGDTDNDFDYVDLVENVNIQGNGVNLKLGAIFKPNNSLRFGLALHTPTWYSMTDVSTIAIEANTENFQGVRRYDPDQSNLFEYRFNTPMKAIASGTALFKKKGFISADVEWVNYDGMQYRYDNGFEAAELAVNNAIETTFKDALNIRVGGEIRIDQMAIRAGYAMYGNPYENYNEGAAHSGSLGLGYRSKNFYLDIAGRYLLSQDVDATHTLARNVSIPTANIRANNTQISMTAGFRF
jgi:hypothetical protein